MRQVLRNVPMAHGHLTRKGLFGVLQVACQTDETGSEKSRQVGILQRLVHRDGNIFQISPDFAVGVGFDHQPAHRTGAVDLQGYPIFPL